MSSGIQGTKTLIGYDEHGDEVASLGYGIAWADGEKPSPESIQWTRAFTDELGALAKILSVDPFAPPAADFGAVVEQCRAALARPHVGDDLFVVSGITGGGADCPRTQRILRALHGEDASPRPVVATAWE